MDSYRAKALEPPQLPPPVHLRPVLPTTPLPNREDLLNHAEKREKTDVKGKREEAESDRLPLVRMKFR